MKKKLKDFDNTPDNELISNDLDIIFSIDPITRYVHISYKVPSDVSDEIVVSCKAYNELCCNNKLCCNNELEHNQLCYDELNVNESSSNKSNSNEFEIPSVLPYISETALGLIPETEWENGILNGQIIERCAKGTIRTIVWNPFLRFNGEFSGKFIITITDNGKDTASGEVKITLDNSDVIVINDWSKVIQNDLVSENPLPGANIWQIKKTTDDEPLLFGSASLEAAEKGVELSQLTYPLNIKGNYAVFVSTPPKLGAIELRFTGDDRTDIFTGARVGEERLWRWSDMTRQHIVIKQPYRTIYEYEEEYRAYLDTIRLVPLTGELIKQLEENRGPDGERKLVAGYLEPYSWAFYDKIERNLQHWEPLIAFADACLDIVDIQYGRGGSKMSNETRVGDQLIKDTFGDPVRGKVPRTSNVGRMQQYTNMLSTELKYSRMLNMIPFANLGATNCYPGTPLESEFSKLHPGWREGSCLRYEIPEVRRYVLSLVEEALEIGAEGVSIDWCRYPNSVKDKETVMQFFRELRALTDKYAEKRGRDVKVLTRFPAKGANGWKYMDYETWVKEGLIDFLCPSNIQGRHMNFDIGDYVKAVQGTNVKLLPCLDGLFWGFKMPGMWFQRILKCYEDGADGIYIYQCDNPVLGSPETRRYVSMIGYIGTLRKWQENEKAKQSSYSKNIYVNSPHSQGKYMPWARLRAWCEGFEPEVVELLVDGQLMNTYNDPPYVLTSEEHEDDNTIRSGTHILKIRAKDGDVWLEKEFEVVFN